MALILPEKFTEIIKQDGAIHGALLSVMSEFSGWLNNNKTEFFPEYTDHGNDHVQSVFNTAQDIIRPDAWPLISPEDIYVLSCSILLHDCAMHINKAGLWNLLQNDAYNVKLLGFGNEATWQQRWQDFEKKVSKFSEADFVKLTGRGETVALPDIGAESVSDYQKILIGDFMRTYHACLAQVISHVGLPNAGGPLPLFNADFPRLNQLAGFIARSHNHGLREAVDTLKGDQCRKYLNTWPTFLMGILRIADYLQIQCDRTPKMLFNTLGFCSPISVQEWKKHLAVIDAHSFGLDRERLNIEAFPQDPKTLTGLQSLFQGLQSELDEFWAVMGEVYSQLEGSSGLGITLRRVRSNIDDAAVYVEEEGLNFHPKLLSIHTNSQQLFPLLVKPLYGDRVDIGVRELLQNALDATNERFSIETGKNPMEHHVPYEIDIILDEDNNTLTIKDRGVGMSADTIEHFFLKIGSSYRVSEAWHDNHTDEYGSRVPRIGKFGIGMLAGFLLGDRIGVTTREHCEGSKSISFEYALESNDIQLNYSEGGRMGTSITVHMDKARVVELKNSFANEEHRRYWHLFDSPHSYWYYLDSPVVNIFIIEQQIKNNIDSPISEDSEVLELISKQDVLCSWQRVAKTDLGGFHWRFMRPNTNGYVLCNGLELRGVELPETSISSGLGRLEFNSFAICLFDYTGLLPLNLTRDRWLTSGCFASEHFIESFHRWFFPSLKSEVARVNLTIKFTSCIFDTYFSEHQSFNLAINNGDYVDAPLFVPLVFDRERVRAFGAQKALAQLSDNESGLTLVDFRHDKTEVGLIHSPSFERWITQASYTFFAEVDNDVGVIDYVVRLFLADEVFEHSDYTSHLLTWVFVERENLNDFELDASMYDYTELKQKGIGEKWVALHHSSNTDDVPELAYEIINNGGGDHAFMFSLYKVVKEAPTEFSQLWEQYADLEP